MWDAVTQSVAWLESSPSVVAWLIGWAAALSVAQAFKAFVTSDIPQATVIRATQGVAVVTGALVSWLLWPPGKLGGVVTALVIGMSAPLAYSWARAVIAWKFPQVAASVSRQQIVARRKVLGK